MDQYQPPHDLALDVAHLMGDTEVIESRSRRVVYTELPPTIVQRMVEKVRSRLPFVKKPVDELPGRSAQSIANTKRKGPLFE